MKVLFLNGSLGQEQRFLRDSLSVIEFIDMDFEPIFTSKNAREQRNQSAELNWPLKKFEAEFADPEKYDVFILCNVDSRALHDASHTATLQALADAVTSGKGLLMLGGPHSFGAGLYHQTPLNGILPIEMKPTERQEFDQDIRKDLHINSPFKVAPTMDHFLTRISSDGNDRQAWAKLPPLLGANRIKVKDTATVYLQSDDDVKRPILASSTINGRVLVFAGDSSWRWKRYKFGDEYDQFWRQVILWLAGWDNKSDESVSIVLPKRRFSPKAIVNFDVTVKTIAGEAVEGVTFESKLIKPDGQSDVITINQAGDKYQSELDPDSLAEPGLYKIQVAASRNGTSIGTAERELVVMDRDKEKSNPMANPEQLKKLTSQTSKFGGKTIGPEQVSEILDAYINDPPMTKIEVPLKWRLGESFPSAALFLSAFVALLGVEWLLRKKWGLV